MTRPADEANKGGPMSMQIATYLRSNVLGLVAIFIALTGTAVALPGKNKVDSGDIINGQVKKADLKNLAVKRAKLGPDAVDSSKVVDGSLTGADIDESTLAGIGAGSPSGPAGGALAGSYPNPQLAADSVNSSKVADDSLTGADIAEAGLDSAILQRRVSGDCPAPATIRQIAQDGSVACQSPPPPHPVGPAFGALAGNYPSPTIRAGAVGAPEVADNSLTGADIADNSLGGADVNEASLDGIAETATAGGATECDPSNNGQLMVCETLTTDIVTRAPALVFVHTRPVGQSLLGENGFCYLYHGSSVRGSVSFIVSSGDRVGSSPFVGFTTPSSSNVLTVRCRELEDSPDLYVDDIEIRVFGV